MHFEEWLHGFYGPYSTRYEWIVDSTDKGCYKTIEKFLRAAYEAGVLEGIKLEKDKDYEC